MLLNIPLFPCFYKQLFGFSCPFCGGQRAIVLLLNGEWWESIKCFPPLFPLIISIIVMVFLHYSHTENAAKKKLSILIINAAILILNCIYQNLWR